MRIVLFAGLLLAACSPSPLYVGHRVVGTPGEIPRDGRGEPIWDKIGPVRGPGTVDPTLPAPPVRPR